MALRNGAQMNSSSKPMREQSLRGKISPGRAVSPVEAEMPRRPKSRLWILLLLVAFILGYSAISIYKQQEREMERLVAEKEELTLLYEAEVHRGKQANELNAMVGSAQYIERLARDNLGLVSPEEIIFIHR